MEHLPIVIFMIVLYVFILFAIGFGSLLKTFESKIEQERRLAEEYKSYKLEMLKENRRLKRALYKACEKWMINRQVAMACYHLEARAKKFDKAIARCRAMADEYKEVK